MAGPRNVSSSRSTRERQPSRPRTMQRPIVFAASCLMRALFWKIPPRAHSGGGFKTLRLLFVSAAGSTHVLIKGAEKALRHLFSDAVDQARTDLCEFAADICLSRIREPRRF